MYNCPLTRNVRINVCLAFSNRTQASYYLFHEILLQIAVGQAHLAYADWLYGNYGWICNCHWHNFESTLHCTVCFMRSNSIQWENAFLHDRVLCRHGELCYSHTKLPCCLLSGIKLENMNTYPIFPVHSTTTRTFHANSLVSHCQGSEATAWPNIAG